MSDSANDTIGTIIGPGQKRDAIHVAVMPAIAAYPMWPGEHVGFLTSGAAGKNVNPVGIVDPFLNAMVRGGEWFWLFIYPRQITSLRHVWTHPTIPEEAGTDVATEPAAAKPTKEESEKWLRDFAETHDCPDYEVMVAAAAGEYVEQDDPDCGSPAYDNDGEYITFYGRDAHAEIPDEFWDHLENLKGKKLTRAKCFSCSC